MLVFTNAVTYQVMEWRAQAEVREQSDRVIDRVVDKVRNQKDKEIANYKTMAMDSLKNNVLDKITLGFLDLEQLENDFQAIKNGTIKENELQDRYVAKLIILGMLNKSVKSLGLDHVDYMEKMAACTRKAADMNGLSLNSQECIQSLKAIYPSP